MKNKLTLVVIPALLGLFIYASPSFAVEIAPRISDREIIEKLARLEEGQNTIRAEIKAVDKRFEAVDKRFEAVDKRFEAVDKRFDDLRSDVKQLREDINQRFDDIRWILGLFVTITLVILGFVLRMQWQMHRNQTQMETTLETQKDELSFLKTLIEKLLPPKGVL